MPNRARDWLAQAEHDLEHGVKSLELEHFDWTCFAAHQAAEKALKAVYLHLGGEARGHALLRLTQGLAERITIPDELSRCAPRLDRCYIPTRYPNGWAEGSPKDYYTPEEAEHALVCARAFVRFGQSVLAGPGGTD